MINTGRATILITGASGFVGTALVNRLRSDPRFLVRAASRRAASPTHEIETVVSPGLGPDADWSRAVRGAHVVIHLAARVHVMRDTANDPLVEFRTANVAGTVRLAHQAAAAGVKRFVYVSSIKVNGERTMPGAPFTERDQPNPLDAYGVSKHEAEVALKHIARDTGMETVVIRPPLIYGPGVKANFRRMMGWLQRGIPLPFGMIDNRRTLVGIDNLIDLIVTTAGDARAANETFMAGDGEDLSTPDLLTRLGLALGTPARLIPVPVSVVKRGLGMIGQRQAAERLCESLQVDTSRARDVLGWEPPLSVDEGLRRVAADFLAQNS